MCFCTDIALGWRTIGCLISQGIFFVCSSITEEKKKTRVTNFAESRSDFLGNS